MSRPLLPTFAGDNARLVAALSIALRAAGMEAKVEPIVYPTVTTRENGEGVMVDGYIIATAEFVEVPEREGIFRVEPRTRLAWHIGVETPISGGRWEPEDVDYTPITAEPVPTQLAAKFIVLALAEYRISAAFEYEAEREMALAEARETAATHARVNDPRCPRQQGGSICRCEEFELEAMRAEFDDGAGDYGEDGARSDLEYDVWRERTASGGRRLGP
jgi:hypothetical protein